jgi:uncharacterized protein (TIGR02301 family)
VSPVALALLLTLAQGAPAAKPSPTPTPTPRAEAPPYEADLLRFAELMGALAYLRDLCHEGDGAEFRSRMAHLIASDPSPQESKDQLAGAFNRGFESYRITYRVCTGNARDSMTAYLDETQRLAKDVAAHYGGG